MTQFVKHTNCVKCNSSDAYALYVDDNGHESGHCFSCQFTVPSKDYIEANEKPKYNMHKPKVKMSNSSDNKGSEFEIKPDKKDSKAAVTPEQTAEIKERTSIKGNGYRGIDDYVLKKFSVRTEYTEDSGEVHAVYYPCTEDGSLSGWKPRVHPKSFGGSIGRTGATCDLFGQFLFKQGGKVCLIVGGEHDALAAYQMLREYYSSKSWDFETPVVSPTIGETGCAKQLALQYKFFDSFEKIIVGFDNDEAGKKATEKAVEVLPKGKVFIANWTSKDPNDMLLAGKQRMFINDFYSAKQYVPDGIIASNQLSEAMREELMIPKVPLPPFMHKLQDMMAGGLPLGRIINLGSASGTGKSTILDECIYYWIFNSPHMVSIVSLESSKGQYGLKLLSRHVSNKIELMDNESALAFINSDEIKAKEYELFNKHDGTPRFYLIDERDSGLEVLKGTVENLIISCGCKVIVLDPLQDILEGLDNEEQALFMKWQKGMVKSHGVTFCNVSHVRKSSGQQKANSTGADLHEEDLHGASNLYKSAACNLLFSRNKEAEDDIERNTTTMKATKIRWTGKTGIAGQYYYDNQTHTMYDLDDWLMANGKAEF